MNQQKNQMLFALLRSAISGTKLTEEEINAYSPELIQELLKISLKHDLAHLLAHGLKQNGLITEESTAIEKFIFKAVLRYQRLKYDYDNMCAALEKAGIPFLPLKGSVIRKYYPEPWMRTSCDIDILVHEEDIERAKAVLVDGQGYTYHGKTLCDISLFTPSNTHVELHHSLLTEGVAKESAEVLKDVWSALVLHDGYSFWYEMTYDLYYFYHIAHIAKHFENGGCGIRPFIDILLLDAVRDTDIEKRDNLLRQGKLLTFANAVRKLARIWFENEEYDSVSKEMENYILSGGVYGNESNRAKVHQGRSGGRLRYIISRAFLPYEQLKYYYPILKKHKWLTPFMEVRRLFKMLFRGVARRSVKELNSNTITREQVEKTQSFLKEIGL